MRKLLKRVSRCSITPEPLGNHAGTKAWFRYPTAVKAVRGYGNRVGNRTINDIASELEIVPRALLSIAGVRVCHHHWALVVRIAARAWHRRTMRRLTHTENRT